MMILSEDPRITELNELFPGDPNDILEGMEVVFCPFCGDEAPNGRLISVLDEDPSVGYSATEIMCELCAPKEYV